MTIKEPSKHSDVKQALSAMQRKPKRITLTLNQATFERLQAMSDLEGRSLSNLCAFMLEAAVKGALASGATTPGLRRAMGAAGTGGLPLSVQ
jgi:hypothetical protein